MDVFITYCNNIGDYLLIRRFRREFPEDRLYIIPKAVYLLIRELLEDNFIYPERVSRFLFYPNIFAEEESAPAKTMEWISWVNRICNKRYITLIRISEDKREEKRVEPCLLPAY